MMRRTGICKLSMEAGKVTNVESGGRDAVVNAEPASKLTESVVEDAALDWLKALGYDVRYGPDIAAGEAAAERSDPGFRDVILDGRLRRALARLNRDLPCEALDDALRKLIKADAPSLIERNRAIH